MAASLKDNITFGLPYDEARYHQVVSACALLDDIEQLPAENDTELVRGEGRGEWSVIPQQPQLTP